MDANAQILKSLNAIGSRLSALEGKTAAVRVAAVTKVAKTSAPTAVDKTLKALAEAKLQRWSAKDAEGKSNPEIVGFTNTQVKIAFNSYGRRVVNSYKADSVRGGDRKGELYLNKIGSGKVVGDAIFPQ